MGINVTFDALSRGNTRFLRDFFLFFPSTKSYICRKNSAPPPRVSAKGGVNPTPPFLLGQNGIFLRVAAFVRGPFVPAGLPPVGSRALRSIAALPFRVARILENFWDLGSKFTPFQPRKFASTDPRSTQIGAKSSEFRTKTMPQHRFHPFLTEIQLFENFENFRFCDHFSHQVATCPPPPPGSASPTQPRTSLQATPRNSDPPYLERKIFLRKTTTLSQYYIYPPTKLHRSFCPRFFFLCSNFFELIFGENPS